MTNEERRAALNKARRKALEFAEATESVSIPSYTTRDELARRAEMWAAVANAMKDGDPVHDAPDGRPINNVINTEYGAITR